MTRQGGTTFTFVSDGIHSALAKARAAAEGKDVSVAGGAQAIQQYLQAGLVDELQLHLIPVLLGGGTPLFEHTGAKHIELEKRRVIDTPGVTHMLFRVVQPT